MDDVRCYCCGHKRYLFVDRLRLLYLCYVGKEKSYLLLPLTKKVLSLFFISSFRPLLQPLPFLCRKAEQWLHAHMGDLLVYCGVVVKNETCFFNYRGPFVVILIHTIRISSYSSISTGFCLPNGLNFANKFGFLY